MLEHASVVIAQTSMNPGELAKRLPRPSGRDLTRLSPARPPEPRMDSRTL